MKSACVGVLSITELKNARWNIEIIKQGIYADMFLEDAFKIQLHELFKHYQSYKTFISHLRTMTVLHPDHQTWTQTRFPFL